MVLYSRRWAGKPLTDSDLSIINLWLTASKPRSFRALVTSPARSREVGAIPAEIIVVLSGEKESSFLFPLTSRSRYQPSGSLRENEGLLETNKLETSFGLFGFKKKNRAMRTAAIEMITRKRRAMSGYSLT